MEALRGSVETGGSPWFQKGPEMGQKAWGHQMGNSVAFGLKQQRRGVSWSRGKCSWVMGAVGTKAEHTQTPLSYDLLRHRLAAGQWQLADEETRRLLIVLSGEAAVKRNYIFFSEVQFIPVSDLNAIDGLWRAYSNNKFGYSVQRRIWKNVSQDFTAFFKKVGWMKRLDTETEQYTYRSFPSEFVWEFTDSTPEGHLPLTNALRGTQLLASIFAHPAFDSVEDDGKLRRVDGGMGGRQSALTPDYKLL